jgi:hypothetical protein
MADEKNFPKRDGDFGPGNNKRQLHPLHTSPSSSMASTELKLNLLGWTESDVHSWLSSLGFPQYETQIRGGRPLALLFSSHPTDRPVYHQRITSQAMSSLSSTQIHSRRLVLRRSVNGFRFLSTSITPNSPTTSPSNRTITSLRVCRHAPNVHVPRLTGTFCRGGGRQARRPER